MELNEIVQFDYNYYYYYCYIVYKDHVCLSVLYELNERVITLFGLLNDTHDIAVN